MPSKNLIRAAEALHKAKQNPFPGMKTDGQLTDFKKLMDKLNKLHKIAKDFLNTNLFKKENIIKKAINLSSSTKWKETHLEFKKLEIEWKKIFRMLLLINRNNLHNRKDKIHLVRNFNL